MSKLEVQLKEIQRRMAFVEALKLLEKSVDDIKDKKIFKDNKELHPEFKKVVANFATTTADNIEAGVPPLILFKFTPHDLNALRALADKLKAPEPKK